MINRLKELRVDANMTQSKLATAIGVSQPNYHRWETDKDPIPEDKLKKLAKVLNATPEAILGKQPPRIAAFYDDSAPEDLQYYGEVAVHFANGSKPLLLSISEATFQGLYRNLQDTPTFLTVKALSNQYVIIRASAISDLYFSSEAYDDYGPEQVLNRNPQVARNDYGQPDIQLPDNRDWEIIECLPDGFGLEDFDPAEVERVSKMVQITDEQYKQLVADGLIKSEDLETERAKNDATTQRIFDLANNVHYRLSTGQERSIYIHDTDALYNAFWELIELETNHADTDDDMIHFPVEGYHRSIFINKGAVDYISIPAHQFEKGRIDQLAQEIDAFEKITEPKKRSRKNIG